MTVLLNIILSFGFAAVIAGVVQLWRRLMGDARREDLRALAARRGWSLNVTDERLGRKGALRIASRGGHRWTVETRSTSQRGKGSRMPRTDPATEYEADEPRWPEGTLLVAMARAGQSFDDDPRGRVRLLGEDTARLGAQLIRVGAPEGIVVYADADPSPRFDLGDIARVFADWGAIAPGHQGSPVLILSQDGLRLRVRHPIGRADQMERFIDLALGLTRLIGP